MNLTAEQLKENFDRLLKYIETYIQGERKDKLITFYKKYEERMIFAPASAKEHYHCAFPGGYVVHVLNVVDASLKLFELWTKFGANVSTFTIENLVFCALNHDLGKIGDDVGEYYLPNDSDWHRVNQGKIYKFNPDIQYMNVSDRTIFMLQANGIQFSQFEYLGMYLADGLYEEKNKPYFVTYEKDFIIKTNLPYIIHHADMVSLAKERDEWRAEVELKNPLEKIQGGNPQTFPKKAKSDPQKRNNDLKATFEKSATAMTAFDELFKKKEK